MSHEVVLYYMFWGNPGKVILKIFFFEFWLFIFVLLHLLSLYSIQTSRRCPDLFRLSGLIDK